MKKLWRKIKNGVKKFFLIDDTPHKIAGGFALGVFWGIMPGEGVATTLITAVLLRLNRLSATAGVAMSNMWSTFIVLPLAAIFGGFLFGSDPNTLISDFQDTYSLGLKYFFSEIIFMQIVLPLLVGFFLVSVSISAICYGSIFYLMKYRKVRFK